MKTRAAALSDDVKERALVASFEPRPGARVAPLGSPERSVEVSP